MKRIVLPIFEIGFCILLISSLILKASGNSNYFTFQGFIELIANAPHLDFISTSPFIISGNWGIFEFLRIFLDSIGQILTLALNLAIEILNLEMFMGYFAFNLFFIIPGSTVVV